MAPWRQRSIRPPDDAEPAVTADTATPPGVTIEGDTTPATPPPVIRPSAWAGWPSDWNTPLWGGQHQVLTDTAWACLDLNSSVLSTMPPYLTGNAQPRDVGWMENPNPDVYVSWEEFAKSLFWDFQLGEAFVLATARYVTGYPARFHVVPPWAVQVEIQQGERRYTVGSRDVTSDMLHIRYQGSVDDAHGHGPLEAAAGRIAAAGVLARYALGFAETGGVPYGILTHPEELTAEQATDLLGQWVASRMSRLGEPAVLSGGVQYETLQTNPKDAGLVELSQHNESRIAVMLGVPPFLVGLPSGGDSMTYSNVASLFDYHWRAGLRPKAQSVMAALSGWLLPRGTRVEVNRDAYVQPAPLERAQTAEILLRLGVLSVDEIRDAERFSSAAGAMGIPAPSPVPTPQPPLEVPE